jgi:hypothetical protein
MSNGTGTGVAPATHWNVPPNANLLVIEELNRNGLILQSKDPLGAQKDHRWNIPVPIKGPSNVHCKSPSTKFVLAGGTKGTFVRIELIKGQDPIKEICEISYTGSIRRAAISDCGKIAALHTTDRSRPLYIVDIDSNESIARPQVPPGRIYHTLKLNGRTLEAVYSDKEHNRDVVDTYNLPLV